MHVFAHQVEKLQIERGPLFPAVTQMKVLDNGDGTRGICPHRPNMFNKTAWATQPTSTWKADSPIQENPNEEDEKDTTRHKKAS